MFPEIWCHEFREEDALLTAGAGHGGSRVNPRHHTGIDASAETVRRVPTPHHQSHPEGTRGQAVQHAATFLQGREAFVCQWVGGNLSAMEWSVRLRIWSYQPYFVRLAFFFFTFPSYVCVCVHRSAYPNWSFQPWGAVCVHLLGQQVRVI